MGTKVGLWIDHRKAIVVAVTDKEEELALIISAVEKQARRSLGSRHEGPYEPQQVRRMTAVREPIQHISTFTTTR